MSRGANRRSRGIVLHTLGARQRMERGERSLLPAIPRPEAGKLANVAGLSNRGRSRFSRSLQRRSIEAGPNPLKSPLLRE